MNVTAIEVNSVALLKLQLPVLVVGFIPGLMTLATTPLTFLNIVLSKDLRTKCHVFIACMTISNFLSTSINVTWTGRRLIHAVMGVHDLTNMLSCLLEI